MVITYQAGRPRVVWADEAEDLYGVRVDVEGPAGVADVVITSHHGRVLVSMSADSTPAQRRAYARAALVKSWGDLAEPIEQGAMFRGEWMGEDAPAFPAATVMADNGF